VSMNYRYSNVFTFSYTLFIFLFTVLKNTTTEFVYDMNKVKIGCCCTDTILTQSEMGIDICSVHNLPHVCCDTCYIVSKRYGLDGLCPHTNIPFITKEDVCHIDINTKMYVKRTNSAKRSASDSSTKSNGRNYIDFDSMVSIALTGEQGMKEYCYIFFSDGETYETQEYKTFFNLFKIFHGKIKESIVDQKNKQSKLNGTNIVMCTKYLYIVKLLSIFMKKYIEFCKVQHKRNNPEYKSLHLLSEKRLEPMLHYQQSRQCSSVSIGDVSYTSIFKEAVNEYINTHEKL